MKCLLKLQVYILMCWVSVLEYVWEYAIFKVLKNVFNYM